MLSTSWYILWCILWFVPECVYVSVVVRSFLLQIYIFRIGFFIVNKGSQFVLEHKLFGGGKSRNADWLIFCWGFDVP